MSPRLKEHLIKRHLKTSEMNVIYTYETSGTVIYKTRCFRNQCFEHKSIWLWFFPKFCKIWLFFFSCPEDMSDGFCYLKDISWLIPSLPLWLFFFEFNFIRKHGAGRGGSAIKIRFLTGDTLKNMLIHFNYMYFCLRSFWILWYSESH